MLLVVILQFIAVIDAHKAFWVITNVGNSMESRWFGRIQQKKKPKLSIGLSWINRESPPTARINFRLHLFRNVFGQWTKRPCRSNNSSRRWCDAAAADAATLQCSMRVLHLRCTLSSLHRTTGTSTRRCCTVRTTNCFGSQTIFRIWKTKIFYIHSSLIQLRFFFLSLYLFRQCKWGWSMYLGKNTMTSSKLKQNGTKTLLYANIEFMFQKGKMTRAPVECWSRVGSCAGTTGHLIAFKLGYSW